MAIQTIETVCVLFLFLASCEAKPENCSEVQCELLPVGEGLASEFHQKVSEKGVRMIYFNLKIGNDSYHPLDSPKLFLPERWVWANSISEPMLSLSYDYDVLSLGLLTYQVRSVDAPFADQPSGCLVRMNMSCQNKVVARALLNSTTRNSDGTDTVCVKTIVEASSEAGAKRAPRYIGNIIYSCCGRTKRGSAEESSIQCEFHVKSSVWFKIFYGILNVLTYVMLFYSPVLLLALPDFIINLRKEYEVECRLNRIRPEDTSGSNNKPQSLSCPNVRVNIKTMDHNGKQSLSCPDVKCETSESADENLVYFLDDTSPITCSSLLLNYTKEYHHSCSFKVRLAFLSYCVIPLVLYIEMGIFYFTKRDILDESISKPKAILGWFVFNKSSIYFYVGLFAFVITYLFILVARPSHFLNKRDQFIIFYRGQNLFLGELVLKTLKTMQERIYYLVYYLIELHKSYLVKLLKLTRLDTDVTGCTLCYFVIIFLCELLYVAVVVAFFGLFLGAVYFCVFLVGSLLLILLSSPFCCVLLFLYIKSGIPVEKIIFYCFGVCSWCFDKCLFLTVMILSTPIAFFFVCFVLIFNYIGALSCRFIVRMFGFIIMGLVLNAEIASPFVTFLIVATGNMYLCYYNLQMRYQDVKQMISQKWQEHRHLLDKKTDLSDAETIPAELFWYICGEESNCKNKVLPVRPEIFRMIRNMALILIFLFLSLCAIIFLGNMHSISGVVSTIAVFVTGVIPGLFFKGLTKEKRFNGQTRRTLMNKIEKAVKEYIDEEKMLKKLKMLRQIFLGNASKNKKDVEDK